MQCFKDSGSVDDNDVISGSPSKFPRVSIANPPDSKYASTPFGLQNGRILSYAAWVKVNVA
jgi:hypothetical protein